VGLPYLWIKEGPVVWGHFLPPEKGKGGGTLVKKAMACPSQKKRGEVHDICPCDFAKSEKERKKRGSDR